MYASGIVQGALFAELKSEASNLAACIAVGLVVCVYT